MGSRSSITDAAARIFRQESSITSTSSDSTNSGGGGDDRARNPHDPSLNTAGQGSGDGAERGRSGSASGSSGGGGGTLRRGMEDFVNLFRRRSVLSASTASTGASSAGRSTSICGASAPQRIPTKAVNEFVLDEFLERQFGGGKYRIDMKSDQYEIYAPHRVRMVEGRLEVEK